MERQSFFITRSLLHFVERASTHYDSFSDLLKRMERGEGDITKKSMNYSKSQVLYNLLR
jgi:hypothetical protein